MGQDIIDWHQGKHMFFFWRKDVLYLLGKWKHVILGALASSRCIWHWSGADAFWAMLPTQFPFWCQRSDSKEYVFLIWASFGTKICVKHTVRGVQNLLEPNLWKPAFPASNLSPFTNCKLAGGGSTITWLVRSPNMSLVFDSDHSGLTP